MRFFGYGLAPKQPTLQHLQRVLVDGEPALQESNDRTSDGADEFFTLKASSMQRYGERHQAIGVVPLGQSVNRIASSTLTELRLEQFDEFNCPRRVLLSELSERLG
jgi:hypothetical protein